MTYRKKDIFGCLLAALFNEHKRGIPDSADLCTRFGGNEELLVTVVDYSLQTRRKSVLREELLNVLCIVPEVVGGIACYRCKLGVYLDLVKVALPDDSHGIKALNDIGKIAPLFCYPCTLIALHHTAKHNDRNSRQRKIYHNDSCHIFGQIYRHYKRRHYRRYIRKGDDKPRITFLHIILPFEIIAAQLKRRIAEYKCFAAEYKKVSIKR